MKSVEELVGWAREHATKLEAEMSWQPRTNEGFGDYWKADSPEALARIRARATSTLEFLRQYAGTDSEWFTGAQTGYHGNTQSLESGARALSEVLRAWADQVESGVFEVPGSQSAGVRAIASTDIMEQVRVLLEDKAVTPAAPIVLAGAALETALRGAVEEKQLTLTERPSMTAYARRLRSAQVISAQDMKDIEQVAGVRNSAAHGEFDALSPERAGLMEQQVNLLLARLRTVLGDE